MKILIVSQYYYPEQFQINEIAPELVRRGHAVTVLCGLPNYPKGVIFEGYKEKAKREEIINGVKVIRCWQKPRGKGLLSLVMNYVTFVINGRKNVSRLADDYDVVLCYQLSPVTMAFPALKYKKKYDVPLILYCLDIWPESAKSQLYGKSKWLYYMVGRMSRSIYQKCDKVLVSSKPFIDYMRAINGVSTNKLAYLPQHADASMLDKDFRKEDDGKTNFMFAGNIGRGQHLETLVDAAGIIGKRKDYLIHVVGDGSERKHIEELVAEKGLAEQFVFYGYQQRENMADIYTKADALLILLRQINAVGLTMPGKLQMYMTLGKPILGAINGAANEVIHESNCGGCVTAEDSEGLSELMLSFINKPENFSLCGKNARQYFCKNFTLKQFVDSLESFLSEILSVYKMNKAL